MDGEEQGEGQEGTNMYTHYNGTHNNVARNSAPPCTEVGGAYGGRWVSDGVHVTRQTL